MRELDTTLHDGAKLACGGANEQTFSANTIGKTFPFTPYCLGATPESRVPTCVCCNLIFVKLVGYTGFYNVS